MKRQSGDIEDMGADAVSKFQHQFPLIQKMRSLQKAAVDTMGCHMLADTDAPPNVQRFQTFISLLLSPRTRDEKTSEAIHNLRKYGLTVDKMIDAPIEEISSRIKMVGMWQQKAAYVKENSIVLKEKFDSDVPSSFDELVSLRGVGPKIAGLTLMHCYDSKDYIGTDTHVHRIANRLWIKTKTPEGTEKELKKIVPSDQYRAVNVALVGFGQTICKARPLCEQCLLQPSCPVSKSFNKKKKK